MAAAAKAPWWVTLSTSLPEPPWWVALPLAPPEPPWWVELPPASADAPPGTAAASAATPAGPPPAAETATPSVGVAPLARPRSRWARTLGSLAAGVLLCVGTGVGLVFLCSPEDRVAPAPLPRAEATPRHERQQAPANLATKSPAGPESLPRPQAEAVPVKTRPVGPDGPPELPSKADRPNPQPAPGAADRAQPVDAALVLANEQAELPEAAVALRWWLASARKAERLQGAALLGRFGSAARGAAPILDYTMRADPDTAVANEAAASLARIGRAGVPYLVGALKHERAAVRQRAAAALARIGPEARSAAPALLMALKDDSAPVRAVTAHALGEVVGDPRLVVPALCLAFGDAAPEVKKQAGLTLVSLGEDAVPALRDGLKSPIAAMRRDIAQVLGMIGADAKAAAGDLALLLKDTDPQVRSTAAEALSMMGREVQAVMPALLQAMRQEKRFEVQRSLLQAITLVGSRDLPGFIKAVREVDRDGKWATPFVLPQFGPRPEDAVQPLIKLLGDPEPRNRMSAALALGKIGLLSEKSVPALAGALEDASLAVRMAAAASLAKLAPTHERLAEFKLSAAVKQMDDFLVAETQRQALVVQRQALVRHQQVLWAQQLALMGQRQAQLLQKQLSVMAQRKAVAEALRPFDWQAALDPALQARFDQIMDLYILLLPGDCPRSIMLPNGLARLVAVGKKGPLGDQVSALAESLPAEALPARVRALNCAIKHNIGFC
jgi:HEAT repeat protein